MTAEWIASHARPGILAAGGILFTFLFTTIGHSRPPSSSPRPENWSDRSYYLSMQDGVRLALSWYFPSHVPPAKPAPILLMQTRYGRARGWTYADSWLQHGYVAAIVDVRGSTASFGARDSEVGPDEQRDMEEIIAHIASQPWSNGKVIASGVSYTADTADMATTRHAPALVASIPRETDWDFWDLFWPGGIQQDDLYLGWGSGVYEIDFGRPRIPFWAPPSPLDCRLHVEDCAKMFPSFQPVDDDPDYEQMRQAFESREKTHKHWKTSDYENAPFRDDKGLNGHSFFDGSAGAHLAALRRERKPVQYWGSWVDTNCADGALNRYRSTPEVPTVVIITSNNHNGEIGADPFFPDRTTPIPSVEEQRRLNLEFADQVLAGQVPRRTIHYYVLGAEVMRETPVWPPKGVKQVRFALDADHRLTLGKSAVGAESYQVDFAASTGKGNRWTASSGPPPMYPNFPKFQDRREQDRKLLTYDSSPVTHDTEVVGWPVVTLRMRSKTTDPAVFAYLEDVAPDGTVTYITEGQLRAIHRKIADPTKLPFDQGPAPHSFYRTDALPVVAGEPFTIKFKLYSVAALIKRGHRLRLAIAGADADSFHRMSAGQPEQFDIYRGGGEPSVIEIPLLPWR